MTEIDNEIQIIVDAWKKKRFLEQQISLIEAVESLDTEQPAIEVCPLGQSNRWLVYNSDTKRPALFTHAGLWAWHSNLKTGNFVPIGKTAPPKTYETRIQNKMSNRCEFSYAFDTQADSSFQDLMMIGFNFGLENWGPDLVPIQFVRVGKAPEHTNSGTDPASWPSDDDTDYELPEGDDVMLIDGLSQMSKRKFEEPSYIDWPSSDDEDTRSMKRLIIDGDSQNVTDDGDLVMADAEDVTEDSAEEQVKTPKRRMLRRGRAD
ncbi:hypothetical protein NLJ89_g9140 [Agrocybe chaxingu]|uniref:Uncharacterized protein n=1 Tax=Agrocybe chaxingu TaxID=84603 RepID=A0A9W8K156_9AGAR|nr:hypothetical protein NLJ89_g9140 [Agrocybe chaxingu]